MTLIGAFAAKPVAAAGDSMPLSDATGVAFGSIMTQVQMSAEEPPLLALPSALVAAELMSASEAETLTSDSAAAIPSLTEEPPAALMLPLRASEAPATPPTPRPTAVAPEAVASEALVFQAAQTGEASPTGQASQPAETGQTGQPSLASRPSLAHQPSPTSEASVTPGFVVSALAPAALASSVPAVPTPQGATTAPTPVPAVVASAAPVAEAETRPTANVTPAPASTSAAPTAVAASAQPLVANAAPIAEPATATPRAVATQVASVIMSIVQRPTGSHQVTLTVNPDSLGPVTVRAHISATGDVRVELFGATDAGRDALRMIVVDLRRDLAAAMPNASLSLSSGSASGSGTASDGATGERASGNAPGHQQPDQGLRPPQREPHLSRNATGPYAAPPTSTETHATPGVALDTFA